jgi:Cu(I)/Ag(I) efflux system membrane fusion protein/cobalt-zinc-cadmium efflux system membrane fusion protein
MAFQSRRLVTVGAFVLLAAIAAFAYVLWTRDAGFRLLGPRVPDNATEVTAPATISTTTPADETARAGFTIDPRRQQLLGVRTAPVERKSLTPVVRAVGLVRYDETRLVDVNLKFDGWIRDLYVDYTGAFVERGQPLFTIYSPDLVTTQNEYLLALATRDQVRESKVADARDHADRLVESARARLLLWDLPADQLDALERTRQARTELEFRSPAAGYVIEKTARQGMHVAAGQSLYTIANLSEVWIEADLYEREMALVRTGAAATVTLDAYPGERFTGRVVYVYPYVEERSRTVKVRFAFANRGGRLKPGMYANVVLQAPTRAGLVVPSDAVLDSGREQVVFVAEGEGRFEPRRVATGRRLDGDVEIVEGLQEGEMVAAAAAFFLDSESQLRSALQAYQAPPASAPGATGAAAGDRLAIAFKTDPDPPRRGENELEVSVTAPDGSPIEDAQVAVVFFMAAMPAMNMPAMRTEAALTHRGAGVYRGTGEVMMIGRWDVTVSVARGGRRAGERQLSVVAR